MPRQPIPGGKGVQSRGQQPSSPAPEPPRAPIDLHGMRDFERGRLGGGQPTAPPQPAPSRTFSQAHCGVLSGGIPAIKCFATTPPPSAASATTRRAKAHMPPLLPPGVSQGPATTTCGCGTSRRPPRPPPSSPPPLSSSPVTCRRGVVKGGGASPWQGFPADRHTTPERGGSYFRSGIRACRLVGLVRDPAAPVWKVWEVIPRHWPSHRSGPRRALSMWSVARGAVGPLPRVQPHRPEPRPKRQVDPCASTLEPLEGVGGCVRGGCRRHQGLTEDPPLFSAHVF